MKHEQMQMIVRMMVKKLVVKMGVVTNDKYPQNGCQ
jgi:hypothetical protein